VYSLFRDKECSIGKTCLSVTLSTHLFSQNLIHLPFPNLQVILLSNQFESFPTSQTLHKSFHQVEHFLSTMVNLMSLHDPYLESKISLHSPSTSTPILHFHLANKVVLNLHTSLFPKPPVSIPEHTLSYATNAIFLPSCPQPQRNLACILYDYIQLSEP